MKPSKGWNLLVWVTAGTLFANGCVDGIKNSIQIGVTDFVTGDVRLGFANSVPVGRYIAGVFRDFLFSLG